MIVRIKGVVEDIIMREGRTRDDRPWQKKVYVIRDNTYNKAEYNRVVHVQDFGRLDPNKMNPEFIFKSDHIKGEEVDLACFLETNDMGFTNVDYFKVFDERDAEPKESNGTGNVIRPDAQPAQEAAPISAPEEETTELPF